MLLAAAGDGAELLERQPVMAGSDWSVNLLAATGTPRMAVPDAARVSHLPRDFAALCEVAGMRSLAVVAVGAPGGGRRPLGALLVGARRPGALCGAEAALWLSAASTGALQHVRAPAVAEMARLLRDVDAADDSVDAIGTLLQVGCGGQTVKGRPRSGAPGAKHSRGADPSPIQSSPHIHVHPRQHTTHTGRRRADAPRDQPQHSPAPRAA